MFIDKIDTVSGVVIDHEGNETEKKSVVVCCGAGVGVSTFMRELEKEHDDLGRYPVHVKDLTHDGVTEDDVKQAIVDEYDVILISDTSLSEYIDVICMRSDRDDLIENMKGMFLTDEEIQHKLLKYDVETPKLRELHASNKHTLMKYLIKPDESLTDIISYKKDKSQAFKKIHYEVDEGEEVTGMLDEINHLNPKNFNVCVPETNEITLSVEDNSMKIKLDKGKYRLITSRGVLPQSTPVIIDGVEREIVTIESDGSDIILTTLSEPQPVYGNDVVYAVKLPAPDND